MENLSVPEKIKIIKFTAWKDKYFRKTYHNEYFGVGSIWGSTKFGKKMFYTLDELVNLYIENN